MGILPWVSCPALSIPLRCWCWWDLGEGKASCHQVSASLILVQATGLERARTGSESLLGMPVAPNVVERSFFAQGRRKKASAAIMDSSVLRAVHTGWFPQTRHSRPARCGVRVCPCTHGNWRPVSCFCLLLGSTTQMHLAGLGVATSDAQRSCFHGNHIGFLLISALSSILHGTQLSSAHHMHPVSQIRKR